MSSRWAVSSGSRCDGRSRWTNSTTAQSGRTGGLSDARKRQIRGTRQPKPNSRAGATPRRYIATIVSTTRRGHRSRGKPAPPTQPRFAAPLAPSLRTRPSVIQPESCEIDDNQRSHRRLKGSNFPSSPSGAHTETNATPRRLWEPRRPDGGFAERPVVPPVQRGQRAVGPPVGLLHHQDPTVRARALACRRDRERGRR